MSIVANKSYAHAVMMINASGQQVTVEAIESVFKVLKLEFSSKIAELFCLPADKIKDILTNTSAAPAAPVAAASDASSKTVAAKVEEVKEESDASIDFGF